MGRAENGNKDEAAALLKRGMAAVTAHGAEKAYTEFSTTTKKIEPETMYCEKQADTVVCAGVYK